MIAQSKNTVKKGVKLAIFASCSKAECIRFPYIMSLKILIQSKIFYTAKPNKEKQKKSKYAISSSS